LLDSQGKALFSFRSLPRAAEALAEEQATGIKKAEATGCQWNICRHVDTFLNNFIY